MEQNVLAKVEAYQEDMWGFLEQIVNIDTGEDNWEGIAQVQHLVGDVLASAGFNVEYLESEGPLQLLARRPRANKPKILIMGHVDTVFPMGTAAERPFKIEEGKAYGPGIIDMKSGVAMGIYTIKAMIDAGFDDADLTFLFVGDKENNHPYSDAVANFKKYGAGMDAVFNMEPGREHGEVVTGRKGIWRPIVQVHGIATHSGNAYKEGASAVLELAKKTIDMFNVTNYETGTTVNVGVFNGGRLNNIVAEFAEGKLDVRFTNVEEVAKVKKQIQDICEHKYDERTTTELIDRGQVDYMPPMEMTEDNLKLLKHLNNMANRLNMPAIEGIYVGGSSDACYTTIAGSPTLCAMGPSSVGPHTNGEFGYVDTYLPRCQVLAMTIMHIGEMEKYYGYL